MPSQSREARIMLAIEATQAANKISVRKAATLYEVSETSVRHRMNGHPSRAECRANGHILEPTEEDAVVQYILDLDMRRFLPRVVGVEDMASLLLAARSTRRVGKQWAYRVVNRQPKLRTHFTRVYDFQRALCEDTKLIQTWFHLVSNMRTKYGVPRLRLLKLRQDWLHDGHNFLN